MEFGLKLQSVLGLVIFVSIALLLSENRCKFNLKTVIILLLTQAVLASAILKTPIAKFFSGQLIKLLSRSKRLQSLVRVSFLDIWEGHPYHLN